MERAPEKIVVDVGTAARDGEDITKRRLRVLKEAETDLVAFLRPGIVPATNWLGALLPYLANPQIAAVGGPVLPATSGGIRTLGCRGGLRVTFRRRTGRAAACSRKPARSARSTAA